MFVWLYRRLLLLVLVWSWGMGLGMAWPLGREIYNEAASFIHPALQPVQLSGPCDFVAFWAAGRMANAGQAADIFQPQKLLAREAAIPNNAHLQLLWFYPPPALLLAGLAAHITPFFRAFFVWIAGLLLLSMLVLHRVGLGWRVIAVAALSPAGLLNTSLGQFGFLTGALFIAGVLLVEQRPAVAGGLFGALMFKPQGALLAPVLLLARRKWGGIAAGGAMALALCVLSLWVYGPDVWRQFFTLGLKISHFTLVQPFPRHPPPTFNSYEFYGVSVFWMCRSFGWSVQWSSLAQSVAALGAVAVCWHVWRRETANPTARMVLTACLALLTTPYGYLYDMCATSIAVSALAFQERRLVLEDVLLFSWPALGLLVAFKFYLELAPVILCLSAWRAARVLDYVAPLADH